MTMQASGVISLQDIEDEHELVQTELSMSDYYSAFEGCPTAGEIKFSDFYSSDYSIIVTQGSNLSNNGYSAPSETNYGSVNKDVYIGETITIISWSTAIFNPLTFKLTGDYSVADPFVRMFLEGDAGGKLPGSATARGFSGGFTTFTWLAGIPPEWDGVGDLWARFVKP